jgi:hypothetical protein
MLNINDMPQEIELLPENHRNFAITLAQDGLINDWSEVFEALNECGEHRPEPDPDSYDYF